MKLRASLANIELQSSHLGRCDGRRPVEDFPVPLGNNLVVKTEADHGIAPGYGSPALSVLFVLFVLPLARH